MTLYLGTFHVLNNYRTVMVEERKTSLRKKHSRGYFITTTPPFNSKYLNEGNKNFKFTCYDLSVAKTYYISHDALTPNPLLLNSPSQT